MTAENQNWVAPRELQRPDWEPDFPGGAVDLGYHQIHDVTVADAMLIAAAPDMLRALKIARDEFERLNGADSCPIEIIDAIESAHGTGHRKK